MTAARGFDFEQAAWLMAEFDEYLRCAHPHRLLADRKLLGGIRNWWANRLMAEGVAAEDAARMAGKEAAAAAVCSVETVVTTRPGTRS